MTDRRLRRCAGALHRRTLAGAVVLGPDDDEPALLAGPGGEVWELLDDGITEDELVAELARRYAVDQATVAADVSRLLDELEARGLAVRA